LKALTTFSHILSLRVSRLVSC